MTASPQLPSDTGPRHGNLTIDLVAQRGREADGDLADAQELAKAQLGALTERLGGELVEEHPKAP